MIIKPQRLARKLAALSSPTPQDPLLPDVEDWLDALEPPSAEPQPISSVALDEPAVAPSGPVWNPQTVASGEAPERRQPTAATTDRRQGYRRIEDRELISRAQQEADMIRDMAREEGYAEGLAQAQQTIDELGVLLQRLQGAEQKALLNAAEQLVPLAVTIAEKVIRTEVRMDPGLTVQLARDLIQQVDVNQRQILFKVHPSEAALLREQMTQDSSWQFNDRQILVMEDPNVEPGGCILETPSGLIDGTLATQLAVVRRLLGLEG